MKPRKGKTLTAKMEAFAQAYVEFNEGLAAWRKSRPDSKASDATASHEASNLLDDPRIQLRIAELRGHLAERVGLDKDKIAAMQLAVFNASMKEGDHAAASTAIDRLAKMYGHDKPEGQSGEQNVVERIVYVKDRPDFSDSRNVFEAARARAVEAQAKAAQQRGQETVH